MSQHERLNTMQDREKARGVQAMIGKTIGAILSFLARIVMVLVFFLVVTPIGLIRRLFTEDRMGRSFDDSKSYRISSKETPSQDMKRST